MMDAVTRRDFEWQAQYSYLIRELVGPHLLRPGTFEEDTERCGDFLVFRAEGLTVAARVRRAGFAERYPWEFTVRSWRETGARTEYEKLWRGFGDWFFYGHAAADGIDITRWMIVDLGAWRQEHTAMWVRSGEKPNINEPPGHRTRFFWYDVTSFRGPLVVAASHGHELRASA